MGEGCWWLAMSATGREEGGVAAETPRSTRYIYSGEGAAAAAAAAEMRAQL